MAYANDTVFNTYVVIRNNWFNHTRLSITKYKCYNRHSAFEFGDVGKVFHTYNDLVTWSLTMSL